MAKTWGKCGKECGVAHAVEWRDVDLLGIQNMLTRHGQGQHLYNTLEVFGICQIPLERAAAKIGKQGEMAKHFCHGNTSY